MNALQTTAISFAAPHLIAMISEIIADAVKPEGVVEFRQDIIGHVTDFVKQTDTPFDDNVASVVTEKIFTLDNFVKWGGKLLDWARRYVQHTLTKFDDYCLPLIDLLEEILISATGLAPEL